MCRGFRVQCFYVIRLMRSFLVLGAEFLSGGVEGL